MSTLLVRAIETQKAQEASENSERRPSIWFVTCSDGSTPMGHWNLNDCTQESVRQVASDQHGEHYDAISVELFPLP